MKLMKKIMFGFYRRKCDFYVQGGGVYNTGHFLDRVVLLRSNPHFCPIFRPSGVIGVIFALKKGTEWCYCGHFRAKKGPSGVIAVISALKFRVLT